MGYPVDMIGKDTKLFSTIGINAIENKLDRYFNRYFKEMDVDCKMMPLNIREDDIGFFLNGLKDSKIKGVFFEQEYWSVVFNLLKPDDKECQFAGICDTIEIEDNSYKPSLTHGKALIELITQNHSLQNAKIAIIGNTPSAKSFLFHLVSHNPSHITFASEYIEEMIELMDFTEKIAHDIVRITKNELKDEIDVCINFSDSSVKNKASYNFHMKNNFLSLMESIAQIKTKDWSNNG